MQHHDRTGMMKIRVALVELLALLFLVPSFSKPELYTAVSGFDKLQSTIVFYQNVISSKLRDAQTNLNKLSKLLTLVENVNLAVNPSNDNDCNSSKDTYCDSTTSDAYSSSGSPIIAFHTIHTLMKIKNSLSELIDAKEFEQSRNILCKDCPQVRKEDLIGSARAIIRLQNYYGFDPETLINTVIGNKRPPFFITPDYCFEIAKEAFSIEDYPIAIEWLEKAIEMMQSGGYHPSMMTNALEYLAFGAYKNGQIKYASDVTLSWLQREPNNERALHNLENYKFHLTRVKGSSSKTVQGDDGLSSVFKNKDSSKQLQPNQTTIEQQKFELSDVNNDKVKDLCIKGSSNSASKLKCIRQPLFAKLNERLVFLRGFKIEILSKNPSIFKVYNFITTNEAKRIIDDAIPKLHRSTVQTSSGEQTPTDHRVAKTAWISKRSSELASTLDSRIVSLLNLNLDDSEDLQVVNYGVGGFYGPHVDALRASGTDGVAQSSALLENDRAVTVLMYLSDVEFGGSTVFPKINVAIEPVKNSAVVWYNLLRNGSGDSLTLHSGCPVLHGSKWIATKWVRERANALRRPCSLNKLE